MNDSLCDLADRQCTPCQGGVPPMTAEECEPYLEQVPGWTIVDGHHLTRRFEFPDFLLGLAFVNAVAGVAEEQGHHPDLHLSWGLVVVEIWTHKIDGLAEADFVLAAKVDRFYQ